MLLKPTLVLKQEDTWAVKDQSLSLIGKVVQIHSDFDREHSQLLGLIFACHQYSNELKILKQELDKKELAAQSG